MIWIRFWTNRFVVWVDPRVYALELLFYLIQAEKTPGFLSSMKNFSLYIFFHQLYSMLGKFLYSSQVDWYPFLIIFLAFT